MSQIKIWATKEYTLFIYFCFCCWRNQGWYRLYTNNKSFAIFVEISLVGNTIVQVHFHLQMLWWIMYHHFDVLPWLWMLVLSIGSMLVLTRRCWLPCSLPIHFEIMREIERNEYKMNLKQWNWNDHSWKRTLRKSIYRTHLWYSNILPIPGENNAILMVRSIMKLVATGSNQSAVPNSPHCHHHQFHQ